MGCTIGEMSSRVCCLFFFFFFFFFRHRLLRDQVALPNLVGAIAIARAIRGTHELDARIKAPNDVRIGKKKSGRRVNRTRL